MWSDYFFYFMSISEQERIKQILLIIGLWCVLLIIGIIIDKTKKKINKKM